MVKLQLSGKLAERAIRCLMASVKRSINSNVDNEKIIQIHRQDYAELGHALTSIEYEFETASLSNAAIVQEMHKDAKRK